MSVRNRSYFEYAIESFNGASLGKCFVSMRYKDNCIFCKNVVQVGQRTKEVYAEFENRKLSYMHYLQYDKGYDRKFKQECWLEKQRQDWVLRKSKLNVCWEERLDVDKLDGVLSTGLLFSYIVLGLLRPVTTVKFSFYNPERNWLGVMSQRKHKTIIPKNLWGFSSLPDLKTCVVTRSCFTPVSLYVSSIERIGFIEWKNRIPVRFSFPHVNIRMYCSKKLVSKQVSFSSGFSSVKPRVNFFVPTGLCQRSIETEHHFSSKDGTGLSGFLETPKSMDRDLVIVLLHGSGHETRDSGIGYQGRDIERFVAKPFRECSRAFVRSGCTVFRYDKRSCGKSKGDWKKVDRASLVEDALASVEYLVDELKYKRCLLVGFSEGANLAISVACRSSDVCGIVLAGAPASSIDKIVYDKLRARVQAHQLAKSVWKNEIKKYQDIISKIQRVDSQRGEQRLDVLIEGYSFEWWAQHLRFHPWKEIQKVNVPILLLHGENDAEVLLKECRHLKRMAIKNNKSVQCETFKGLNHFFTPACVEHPGFEYDLPYTVHEEVLNAMIRWIRDKIVKE